MKWRLSRTCLMIESPASSLKSHKMCASRTSLSLLPLSLRKNTSDVVCLSTAVSERQNRTLLQSLKTRVCFMSFSRSSTANLFRVFGEFPHDVNSKEYCYTLEGVNIHHTILNQTPEVQNEREFNTVKKITLCVSRTATCLRSQDELLIG